MYVLLSWSIYSGNSPIVQGLERALGLYINKFEIPPNHSLMTTNITGEASSSRLPYDSECYKFPRSRRNEPIYLDFIRRKSTVLGSETCVTDTLEQ